MTPFNPRKEIEAILAKIEAYQWPEDDEPTVDAVTLVQATTALLDLLDRFGEELIGKPEAIWGLQDANKFTRNELRVEQRNLKAKLLGKEGKL